MKHKNKKKIPAFVWQIDDEVEVKTLEQALEECEQCPCRYTVYITDGTLDLCTNAYGFDQPYRPDDLFRVDRRWEHCKTKGWVEVGVPMVCEGCNEFMEVKMVDIDGTNLEETWVCPACGRHQEHLRT